MQYHSLSLANQAGLEVHVLAQGGSDTFPAVASHEHIHIHTLPDTPRLLQKLPRAALLVVKPVLQSVLLLWMMLARMPAPAMVLLQLPPAVPTMAVVSLAAWWHHARLIYDWHNFAYTLMALNLGRHHWLVHWSERYERAWAPHAWASLCVSKAMQKELARNWKVKAALCYDRPPAHFAPTPLAVTHELLQRLGGVLRTPVHPQDCIAAKCAADDAAEVPMTLMTKLSRRGAVRKREGRPALVVSSTSWTPDEDFGVLLSAVRLYDQQAQQDDSLPPLLVVVTGRGPLLAEYQARLRRCAVRTAWLAPGDYPLLLGAADVGVCLHTSSSGLDLPMKVLDMFGCQLPVCAMNYETIGELVRDGDNGLLFSSPQQLAQQLRQLLTGFPAAPSPELKHMQRVHARSKGLQWDAAWTRNVLPVVRRALDDRT